ncbi:MAG: acetyl-CoA carboxylase biotin carboxyl carrier protein subunit [Halobacteriovoraceae bacterium]|nr:acetyl-CoA carboxylase biotin carboxyl carrier protein subunit [Halobacteriovoraceae bacterium]
MRYYIIDKKDEIKIDLIKTIRHSSELVEFEFEAVIDNKVVKNEILFLRQLAGKYFVSKDQKYWEKIAKQDLSDRILNVNRVFDLHRGFKPSSIGQESGGNLVTQLPGKIVKILVKEGQEVKVGNTLVVLEAMKMENEIKAQADGKIIKIHINEGDVLEQGVLLLEME